MLNIELDLLMDHDQDIDQDLDLDPWVYISQEAIAGGGWNFKDQHEES